MKVLVITNRVPFPLKDGGNIATMQMIESLLNCGYEVKLLSLNTSKHFVDTENLPEVFAKVKLEATAIDTSITFKSAFLNLFSSKSFNAIRFDSDDFRNLIIATVKKDSYDIVHFENIYTSLYIDDIKHHCNSTCVLRPHNIEYEIWERAAKEESLLKSVYLKILARKLKRFEIENWRKFDAIIPISDNDEFVIKYNNKTTTKYLTLPTAIPLDNFVLKPELAKGDAVFHLGSMDWIPNQQGMEWFLNNVWEIVAQETKACFYMAGKNMPDSFKQFEGDNVKIIGEVANALEFMQDKQIMVVPLFAGSGIRIKILEGMAAGKTIITTSIGVQGIDVYDKNQVLIANNPKSFAEALIWCIKNDRKCKEIGLRARKFIETNYNIESFESKLAVFLSNLTNK